MLSVIYTFTVKKLSKTLCISSPIGGDVSMENKQGKLIEKMESIHENFQIFDSGLWINKDFPYLGASPDGIVSCDCCGIGMFEIKVTI